MDEVRKVNAEESVKTVTSNNFITALGLEKLSLQARKMFYLAISQCKKTDKEFYTYEISARDFASVMGVTAEAVYMTADKITDELIRSILQVAPCGEKYFRKYTLFSRCEYDHNGMIRFKLNPDMTCFLLKLKKDFSQPLLSDFLKMRSQYSMSIWHLIQREMHSIKPRMTETIEFDLSLAELRKVTGTQNKLKQIGQFKERCFDKALCEINSNCGVKIKYENIKNGRTIIGFHCKAVSIFHKDLSEISQSTRNKAAAGLLRIKSHNRELTEEEKREYDRLTENAEQIELSF